MHLHALVQMVAKTQSIMYIPVSLAPPSRVGLEESAVPMCNSCGMSMAMTNMQVISDVDDVAQQQSELTCSETGSMNFKTQDPYNSMLHADFQWRTGPNMMAREG
jgi:hypothetical protein